MINEVTQTLTAQERTKAALWGIGQIAVGLATVFVGSPQTTRANKIRAAAIDRTNANPDIGMAVHTQLVAERQAMRAEESSSILICLGVIGLLYGAGNVRKAISGKSTSYKMECKVEKDVTSEE